MRSAPRELGQASSQYELVARLAEGGMAEIFLARSRGMANFGRYVVLKRILPERGADERWIEMFLDEARLVAQLQHPNIAHVFDLGRLGDGYFFTMEYVHGANMREVLVKCSQRGRRLPLSTAVGVGVGAASGLDHAHSRRDSNGAPLGIVHRDVSPSNLMLSYDGVVKLVDFGVAKAFSRSSVTQSGTVKGKVSYLSPEQCRGREVDHRSDLFALGIVLYEMTTTKRLYRRASDFETMTAIVTEAPEPPSRYNPEVSARLDALILRALQKDPARRQQSAGEILEELEEIAQKDGLPISNTHLRKQMRELFGEQPEPWHALESGIVVPKREPEVTYTADGLLEEDLESVEVPVVPELDYGVSGPVPASTAPLRRTAAAVAVAAGPRVTQAFPVEAAADDVPLLDSLRAAMEAASALEGERSASGAAAALDERVDAHGPTATAPPVRSGQYAGAATLIDPTGPPGFLAEPAAPGAADAHGALPRAANDAPSGRAATQPPVAKAGDGPRVSEAITIPTANADRPVERLPQPALASVLAAGQVAVSPSAAASPSPGIWDRPMTAPARPAEPAGPSRAPQGTPGNAGYAPKATLLGSAPPPSARPRSDSVPAPLGDARSGRAEVKLPGVGEPASRPPAAYQGRANVPPGFAGPAPGPGPGPVMGYPPHSAQPVYPRAPIEITGPSARPQPEEAPRRMAPILIGLVILLAAGIGLGALLAGDENGSGSSSTDEAGATTSVAAAPDAAVATPAAGPGGAAATPDAAATAPDAAAAADAVATAATPDAAATAATPDAAVAAVTPDAAAAAPPESTVAVDCKALPRSATSAQRAECTRTLCKDKQLEVARRLYRDLPAATQRELVKECPSLQQGQRPATRPASRQQAEPTLDIPDKPPCTGPLCRR